MISYLHGTILATKERYAIVLAGDVGYRVYLAHQTMEQTKPNDEKAFFIYTNVRDDAIELYGFVTLDELDFFEQLISISGVGPKLALGVLSVAPIEDIKKAIIHGDPTILQKVSSVGKKTAERIIVELKEKITVTSKEGGESSISDNIQLLEALSSLGYKETEIRQTMRMIPADKKDLSDRIKEALRILSQH